MALELQQGETLTSKSRQVKEMLLSLHTSYYTEDGIRGAFVSGFLVVCLGFFSGLEALFSISCYLRDVGIGLQA